MSDMRLHRLFLAVFAVALLLGAAPQPPELAFSGLPPLAGLALSPQGGLFATVAAQGGLVIQIFGSKSWTVLARTGGQPRGLAFDGAGDLYVADNALGRILRITPWGETRVAAARCGGAPIVAPEGVAVAADGSVYFSDSGASRVCRVGKQGDSEVLTLEVKLPGPIAVSAGGLFVADSARKIWRVSRDGKQRNEFATVPEGRPAGMALDEKGTLYVALQGAGKVVALGPAGTLTPAWSVPGQEPCTVAFGGIDMRTLFIGESSAGAVYKSRPPHRAERQVWESDPPGGAIRDPNLVPCYRFSTDDNIWFLRDIARNADKYKSIFDNPYLAMWRDLHSKYGTKFHHNLYYQTEGFNLSQMPDKFRSEWQRNSDWMRLSFHALANDPGRPYVHASAEQIVRDYRLVVREIERFAGKEVLHPITTIHWGETTLAVARALRREGIRILAGYFEVRDDLPSVGYYLTLPQLRHMMGRDYWKDAREDIIFVRHDIVINRVPLAEIDRYLERVASDPNQSQVMELMIHEQYFYPDYQSYEPDYRQRVERAIQWVTKRGYKPVFYEEEAWTAATR
jgi:sugar lactone lactonase YvrE